MPSRPTPPIRRRPSPPNRVRQGRATFPFRSLRNECRKGRLRRSRPPHNTGDCGIRRFRGPAPRSEADGAAHSSRQLLRLPDNGSPSGGDHQKGLRQKKPKAGQGFENTSGNGHRQQSPAERRRRRPSRLPNVTMQSGAPQNDEYAAYQKPQRITPLRIRADRTDRSVPKNGDPDLPLNDQGIQGVNRTRGCEKHTAPSPKSHTLHSLSHDGANITIHFRKRRIPRPLVRPFTTANFARTFRVETSAVRRHARRRHHIGTSIRSTCASSAARTANLSVFQIPIPSRRPSVASPTSTRPSSTKR